MATNQKHTHRLPASVLVTAGLLWLTQTAYGSPRPAWLQTRPVADGFIAGIGAAAVASSTARGAYNQALARALREVATQLNVRVTSVSTMTVTEQANDVLTEYASDTALQAGAELEGTEIMDSWVGADTCWVYVRLDLGDYRERRRLRRLRRLRLEDQLDRLMHDLSNAPPAVALSSGLRAHQLVTSTPNGERPEFGRRRAPILSALRQRLSNLQLTSSGGVVVVDAPDGAEISVVVESADVPHMGASGLPVRWSFASGKGEMVPLTWTDVDGRASTRIETTTPGATVLASIDLDALRPDAWRPLPDDFAHLPVPAASIALTRPRLTAQLAWDVGRDIECDVAGFAGIAASKLAAHGIDVSDTTGKGQLRVLIRVGLSRLQFIEGLCFAFIDVAIEAAQGNTLLARTHASRLKGAGTTPAEAAMDAFLAADEPLNEAAIQIRQRLHDSNQSGGELSADGRQFTAQNRRISP